MNNCEVEKKRYILYILKCNSV